jgi:hypothetical protein
MKRNYSYKNFTTAGTNTFYGGELMKCVLGGIFINKNLTGTLVIKADATTIGTIAAGTAAGTYWNTMEGIEIEKLSIVNGSTEDVTVAYSNN